MSLLKKLFGGTSVNFAELVKQGAMIIDVRSPAEYKGGHIKGSVNIPLDELPKKIADLQEKQQPVITVCRSGNRSNIGMNFLHQQGLKEVYNGGGLSDMLYYQK